MARDIRRELVAAVEAKDVAALAALAYQLLGRVEADDDRRARQAEKKRLERERRLSATSGMSPNVPGRPATSGDIPDIDPTPKRSFTTPPPSAQVIAKLGDEALQRNLDLLRARYTAEEWEDVAAFFLRRKYDRWYEWSKAFLREIGPGSQFEPVDLLRVCQDDGTLDNKLGSGGVLRKFLGPARLERVEGARPPPPQGQAKPGPPRRGERSPPQRHEYPQASDPDKPLKWT